MEIGLQITSIEVYLIGFFLGVLSAFKGRIRSNLATIRDQSHLDWITIKSRTRGGHEELRILLKNLLIPSQFNQELIYKRGRIPFYRRNRRENRRPSDSVKTDRRPRSCDDRGLRSHDPMKIACLILIGRP